MYPGSIAAKSKDIEKHIAEQKKTRPTGHWMLWCNKLL
jgi:hypothetical protein